MKQPAGNVIEFPLQPIDLERVRLEGGEPAIVLILPVVRIDRGDEGPDRPRGRRRRRP